MTPRDATILIAARDAATTIARAVRSARRQGNYPIVLVDDHSSDGTAEIARREDPDLCVVRTPQHGPLGFTRQYGLEAVRTTYGLWLDADDELLPGRTTRLVRVLEANGADLAFDGLDLVDGASNQFLRRCPIPGFLDRPPYLWRLFERNHLPGVGQVAFRTEPARRVGYDAALHGPEDIDFVLRALMAGMRVALVREVGYRMYTYATSVSRDLGRQRHMYRQALLKHAYADVRDRLTRSEASPAAVAWTLTSMAVFRGELGAAAAFLDEAAGLVAQPGACADPAGPCPMPDGWRVAFYRGTLEALQGNMRAARAHLSEAESLQRSPEGANNLGVALGELGDEEGARSCFAHALHGRAEYLDARHNASGALPRRITTHPLRRQPARTDYALA